MKPRHLFTALALCVTAASTATAATTWTMASGYPESNFFTQNIREFIKEVETKSQGRLKIDLRSNDTLIKHDAIKRAVQSGQVPIGEIRLGVYGNEGQMYILDALPNIASNYEEEALLTQAQKPYFSELFGKNGMRVLTYVPWPGQGFYTKAPVKTVADFKGQRLRIYSAPTQKMGDMLGFQSTILPFAEISQAFATGMIEALFTSAQTGTDVQAWENTKYFTYTGSMHNKNAIIVNQAALSRLDKDVQQIVIEAGEHATARGRELSKKANSDKVDVLRSKGMVVEDASPAIQAELKKVGETMIAEWRQSALPAEQKVLDNYLKARSQVAPK